MRKSPNLSCSSITLKHVLLCLSLLLVACAEDTVDTSVADPVATNLSIEENGRVFVEAEAFDSNDANGTERTWYVVTPSVNEDGMQDTTRAGTSGSYIEGLPDTRTTHDDSLIVGVNFYPEAGVGPKLSYKVQFNTPGRYTVWARAFSTGTEDNGIHVGLNGTWPESGQRIQWCEGKHQWTWSSAQRVPDNHCGTEKTIFIDIPEAGVHTIEFSMREDGFEMDQWFMTLHDESPEGL